MIIVVTITMTIVVVMIMITTHYYYYYKSLQAAAEPLEVAERRVDLFVQRATEV